MQMAVTEHNKAETPYGFVIQEMELGLPRLPRWSFCHPKALVYYLSTICAAFGSLMESCSIAGVPMRIIIYIDELCPGNPLRTEKSRTLQAIYWAFADWPQHVLQRTAAWPVFGTIRSTMVEKLPGGFSGVIKRILLIFFAQVGPTMPRHQRQPRWRPP